jgi:hypothetical protein
MAAALNSPSAARHPPKGQRSRRVSQHATAQSSAMQGSAARPRRDVPVVSRKSLPWEVDRDSHMAGDATKPSSRPSSYGALAAPSTQYESTINRVQSMMNRVESTYSAPYASYAQDSRGGAPTRQISAVDSSRMQGLAPPAAAPRASSGGYGDSHRRGDAPQSYAPPASQYAAPAPRVRNASLDEPWNAGVPARARVTPEDADSVFYSSLRGGQADKPGFRFDAAPAKSSFDDDAPRRPRPFSGQNGVPVPNPATKRSTAPEAAPSSLQYDRQQSRVQSQQQQPHAASGYAASSSRGLQQPPPSQAPVSSDLDLLQPRRRNPVATATRKDLDSAPSRFGPSSAAQQTPASDSFSSSRQQPQPASSKPYDAYGSSNLNHAASVAQRGGSHAAPMDERPAANTELFPCPDCGRSFVSSALERHAKICQSVFKGKKKPTDTDPYATGSGNSFPAQQQQQPSASLSGKGSSRTASITQPQRDAGDRWDAPSQSKAASNAQPASFDGYPPSKGSFAPQKPQTNAYDRQPQPQPNYPSASSSSFSVPEYAPGDANADADSGPLEECPDCGRKFNLKAFEKHVKICQKVRRVQTNVRRVCFLIIFAGFYAEAQGFQCYRSTHAGRGA